MEQERYPSEQAACPAWEPELEALLAGDLDADREGLARAHLAECAACRQAFEQARRALAALDRLDVPPLPWSAIEDPERIRAWQDLSERLTASAVTGTRDRSWRIATVLRIAAGVVLLVLGYGIGRALEQPVPPPGTASTEVAETAPTAEAVGALVRAELLADAGLGLARGLQEVVGGVMTVGSSSADVADRAALRDRARELVRSAVMLRRDLDPRTDAGLLAAVRKAELLLEEITALPIRGEADLDLVRTLAAAGGLGGGELEERMTLAIADARRRGGWDGMDGTTIREEPE